MADLLSVARGAGSTAANVAVKAVFWFGIMLVVTVICVGIIFWIRNKKIYSMPVRLIRSLDNGVKREMNGLKGGKVRKNGVFTFLVKIPWSFKKHDLGYMPDMTKTDGDNRLVFMSVGDGTLWQQVEEKIISKEKMVIQVTPEEIEIQRQAIHDYVFSNEKYKNKSDKEKQKIIDASIDDWIKKNKEKTIEYDLIMKPIKTEVKTSTLNSMKNWREVLDKNKVKVFTIAIGAFIIMVIAHLVSLYIQTKIRCPVAP